MQREEQREEQREGPPGELIAEAIRRAVDAAPDGIVIADDTGVIVFANAMACRLFGYEGTSLVGEAVEVLLPEEFRAGHVAHRTAYTSRPRTRPMGSGLDLRGRRQTGEEFPVEISLSPVVTKEHVFVVAIVRDVTDRRRAAEELMAAHEELALVDDRERIARDLHDTVIQRLFAVGLSLQGALIHANDAAIANRIELAIDEIDGTIRDIRTAIFSLHARRSPTAGPRDDVLATAREAARALGFEPQVHFDGPVDTAMSPSVHENLLPTLREALSNMTKHAHAQHAWIDLVTDGSSMILRVSDDGIGIPDDVVSGGRGLGNMRERADALGGTCDVSARAGGGTVVEWKVPLK